tara:strand:+ start:374 stop:1138 length:765 start_codon:yes stop_codon:yes gene_type:complete
MNLASIFTVRFFVISSVLLIGVISAGIMMMYEDVAAPRVTQSTIKPTSVLKSIKYVKANRNRNVEKLGMPSDVNTKVIREVKNLERAFSNGTVNPIITRGFMKNGVRESSAFNFCPQSAGEPDPLYLTAPQLIKPGDLENRPRTISDFNSGSGNVIFPGLKIAIKDIYEAMEETDHGGYTDKPCISIALMLLGEQDTIRDRTFQDANKRTGRPPSCKYLLAEHPGLKKKLIAYMANFHYLAEVAQTPGNGICES